MTGSSAGGRLSSFFVVLLLSWLSLWLLPGLFLGDWDALLHQDPYYAWHVAYLVGLYLVLLMTSWFFLHRWGLKALFSGGLYALPYGFIFGCLVWLFCLASMVFCGYITWSPENCSWAQVGLSLFVALALSIGEEWVFRGVLWSQIKELLPLFYGRCLVSLLFAAVHLFRPGGWSFKLAYAGGLFLAGYVLLRFLELTGSLWVGIGLHSAWIFFQIIDGLWSFSSDTPLWLSGQEGEVISGALGWTACLLAYTFSGLFISNFFPLSRPEE